MNEGLGMDFYRKGKSVKRSGPFSEPPDSENGTVAVLIPFPKISSYSRALQRGKSFFFRGILVLFFPKKISAAP